jgi:hypothetical protein
MPEARRLGSLKQNLFFLFLSLLAFQPPSLQPIVAWADGLMLVFQSPVKAVFRRGFVFPGHITESIPSRQPYFSGVSIEHNYVDG